MKLLKNIFYVILFLGLITNVSFASYMHADGIGSKDYSGQPFSLVGETPAEKAERMKWWTDARFGMFIHWGLYSDLAGEWRGRQIGSIGEWIMKNARIKAKHYVKLTNRFNPVKYNPDEWMRIAKDAGMKYVVITAKHHDGFNLWNSKYTDFDIGSTPYKKDLLKPLAQAAAKHGLTFGLYYSILDWTHPNHEPVLSYDKKNPDKKPNMSLYYKYFMNQVVELINNYDSLKLLWFDGGWEKEWSGNNDKLGKQAYKQIKKTKSSIIVNERIFGKANHRFADYLTPEQRIPKIVYDDTYYWETCMTMNNTWGYKRIDNNWKPPKLIIHNLIDIVSKNGNYLLNIGPKGDGTIPAESVKILKEVGKWMKVNGDAIYGTMGNPYPFKQRKQFFPYGHITTKTNESKMYLHLTKWPYKKLYRPYKAKKVRKTKNNKKKVNKNVYEVPWKKRVANFFGKGKGAKHSKIVLTGFNNKIKRIYALKNKNKSIPYEVKGNVVEILSKNIPKSKMVTVLAVEYEGDLKLK